MSDNSALSAGLQYLRLQQNESGFWPYLKGNKDSAIEPSSWAAIALRRENAVASKFVDALFATQNEDGGWSNESERLGSDWSTAPALFSMKLLAGANPKSKTVSDKAVTWLLDNRSEHFNSILRFAVLLWKGPTSDYERGWPWTQDTFDWVEPTAYVLLSLRNSEQAKQERVGQIITFAEEFLLSLVCKDGGWNFGDRSPIYALAASPPEVQSTAIALLALRTRKQEAKVSKSIDWLIKQKTQIKSIGELSWTAFTLSAYGKENGDLLAKLSELQNKDGSFSGNILTQAIACLAFESAGNPNLLSIS